MSISTYVCSKDEEFFTKEQIVMFTKSLMPAPDWYVESWKIKKREATSHIFGKYYDIDIVIHGKIYHRNLILLIQVNDISSKIIKTNMKNNTGPEHFMHNIFIKLVPPPDVKPFPFAEAYYIDKAVMVSDNVFNNHYSDTKHFDHLHIKVVLHNLARFHAGSFYWQYKMKINYKKEYSEYLREQLCFTDGNKKFQIILMMVESLKSYIDYTEDCTLNGDDLDNFYYYATKALSSMEDFKKVICHGHLNQKSIVFKYEKTAPCDCKFLNNIFLRYAPPAFDVMFFIVNCIDEVEVKECCGSFMNYYYNNLKESLSKYKMKIHNVLTKQEYLLTCKIFFNICKFLNLMLDIFEMVKENYNFMMESNGFNVLEVGNIMGILGDRFTAKLIELQAIIKLEVISLSDIYDLLNDFYGEHKFRIVSHETESLPQFDWTGLYQYYNMLVIVSRDVQNASHRYFIKSTGNYRTQTPLLQLFTVSCIRSRKEIWFNTIFMSEALKHHEDLSVVVGGRFIRGRMNDLLIFDNIGTVEKMPLLKVIPIEYFKKVVDKLARLHATSIIIEEKLTIDKKNPYRLNKVYPKALQEIIFGEIRESKEILEEVCNGLIIKIQLIKGVNRESLCNDEFRENFEKFFYTIHDLIKPSQTLRNVVCHGKLWNEAILFNFYGEDTQQCKLINFDSFRYNSPMQDIAGLIYCSADSSFRRSNWNGIVEHYFECLKKVLAEESFEIIKLYRLRELKISLEKNRLYGLIQAIYLMHASYERNRFSVLLEKKPVHNRASFGIGSDFIDNLMAIDPSYKQRIQELVIEILELFESHKP